MSIALQIKPYLPGAKVVSLRRSDQRGSIIARMEGGTIPRYAVLWKDGEKEIVPHDWLQLTTEATPKATEAHKQRRSYRRKPQLQPSVQLDPKYLGKPEAAAAARKRDALQLTRLLLRAELHNPDNQHWSGMGYQAVHEALASNWRDSVEAHVAVLDALKDQSR